MHPDEVKRRLTKRLGKSLTPGLWAFLVDERYVQETCEEEISLVKLEQFARRILAAGAQPPREIPAPMAKAGARAYAVRASALSDLVAVIAAEDPEVVAYRARYLPEGTIRWDEVVEWIERHGAASPLPTQYLTVPLPNGTEVVRAGRTTRVDPPVDIIDGEYEIATRTLAYFGPDDNWTKRIATVHGAALEALRVLAENLAKSYAWQPAQATLFVLTGLTPLIGQIRATSGGVYIRNQVDCGWAARITLDIDPATPASEVARAYRKVRADRRLGRYRTMSEKHARLAAAASDDAKSWAERLREWNTMFPKWEYTAASNFRRDARRAQRRLLYPAG